MQSLRLLLTMAVAASVHGQRSDSAGRVIDNGIGEASSIRQARADRSHDGVSAVVDAIDRDHGDEQQPRIYVSQAEVSVSLRDVVVAVCPVNTYLMSSPTSCTAPLSLL